MQMLRRLYDWTLDRAAHERAPYALAGISFAESVVFPIPPDVMLAPMVLAHREKAFYFAAICTVASVLGGLLGYAIGVFVFEAIARPILSLYGYTDAFESFAQLYQDHGAWIVAAGGFTPIPFKVITVASGTVQLDLAVFIAASVISRGGRFFIVAGLLYWFGTPIRRFVEERFAIVGTLGFVLLIGGFVVIKWLI